MKLKLTTLLIVFITVSSVAQSTIKGRIIDNTKSPLEGVSVFIKETLKGSQTDANGYFTITNVKDGKYILTVSSIGYKTREIPVSTPSSNLELVLYEGNELLQEVVLGSRNNKFSRKKTAYVAKLPLKDLENSQVYSTITSDLLESQIVTNFDDALKNATGVDKRWEATGRSGDGTGYYSIRGFTAQPLLVDGVPGFTFSAADPSYIERIEVLKGPSATLFGSTVSSLAGLINVVTKKPYEGFGGSVSYTAGSFNSHRISLDINTPLSEKDGLYFRLNTSYLTQDSFQDAGFKNTFFIAPSFSYRASNKLTFSVGLEYSRTKQTNPSMIFIRRGYPLVSTNVDDFGLNINEPFTNNDIYLKNPTFNTRFIADYKISDQWTSQTILSSNRSESNGYYQFVIEGAAVYLLPNPFIEPLLQQDLLTRIISIQDSHIQNYNVQQNFIGDFKIGNVRNRMVLGLDFAHRKQTDNSITQDPMNPYFPVFYGFFLPDGTPFDNPFTTDVVETEYPMSKSIIDGFFQGATPAGIKTRSKTLAAYMSDVINFSPNFSAMIGLRVDHFIQDGNLLDDTDDSEQTRFSPKFGLVYQPILNQVSLFANYQNGFINVDPIIDPDNPDPNQRLMTRPPVRSNQLEGGVKLNLFKGKLNTTLSYYDIKVENRFAINPNAPTGSIIVDEIRSKGIELEINTSPVEGLNIRAGYAYNDSEVTKVNPEYIAVLGRRPEESGPEHLYNIWADYKFQEGMSLQNLGLGLGIDGASEYLTVNNAISGQFTLPKYTLLNASLYYEAEKFRIGIKANNITDAQYYKGWSTINPQAPRAFLGSLVYKF